MGGSRAARSAAVPSPGTSTRARLDPWVSTSQLLPLGRAFLLPDRLVELWIVVQEGDAEEVRSGRLSADAEAVRPGRVSADGNRVYILDWDDMPLDGWKVVGVGPG